MKITQILTIFMALLVAGNAMVTSSTKSRRQFLKKAGFVAAGGLPFLGGVSSAGALDMDAFINKELSTDNTKKDLSKDEALCRFGEPGPKRGDACARAGMSTKGKGGGVDAYGKADRGDFVRCKAVYVIVNDKYEKQFICN